MDFFTVIFFIVFAAVAGRFLYGRVRYGSWTGSFLKGSIVETVGEVRMTSSKMMSQALKIHAMRADKDGDNFVAMVMTSKAPMAATMQPYKLTRSQALELAALLTRAAHHVA